MRRGTVHETVEKKEEIEKEDVSTQRTSSDICSLAKTCIKHRDLTSDEDFRSTAFSMMAEKASNPDFGLSTWHENKRLAALAKREAHKLDFGVGVLSLRRGNEDGLSESMSGSKRLSATRTIPEEKSTTDGPGAQTSSSGETKRSTSAKQATQGASPPGPKSTTRILPPEKKNYRLPTQLVR
jgi:hypothetical protein